MGNSQLDQATDASAAYYLLRVTQTSMITTAEGYSIPGATGLRITQTTMITAADADGDADASDFLGTVGAYLESVGEIASGYADARIKGIGYAMQAAGLYLSTNSSVIENSGESGVKFWGSLAAEYTGGLIAAGAMGALLVSTPAIPIIGVALLGSAGFTFAAAALVAAAGLAGGAAAGWAWDEAFDGFIDPGLDQLIGWVDDVGTDFAAAIREALRRLTDPIVIDMDGDGIELLARTEDGVYFDMDDDGRKELTGWVGPDDALLVIDADRDGQVHSIEELVGDLGRSGFTELATYDSNGDRVIDAADAVWTDLKVWQDANTNGVVDSGEMVTAQAAGLRSIDLRFTTVNFTAAGNQIHEQSSFEWADGSTGLIVDAWFDVDNVATANDAAETGDPTIDALPDIPGNGTLSSLRTAMADDGALTSLVTDIVGRTAERLDGVREAAEQVLYRWADADGIDPASRGGLFDARALAALEAMLGTPYLVSGNPNPSAAAVPALRESWTRLVDGITARLLLAGPLGETLDTTIYVEGVDRITTMSTPAEIVAQLAAIAPEGGGIEAAGFWRETLAVARAILQDQGIALNDASYQAALDQALAPIGLNGWDDLIDAGWLPLAPEVTVNGIYRGTGGNDEVYVRTGRAAVYGGNGDDVLFVDGSRSSGTILSGDAGDDALSGGSYADRLDGGSGADVLVGGNGNDLYIVDDAGDEVVEVAGAGDDTVHSSISYTLGFALENLVLTGTGDLDGIGNSGANRITGTRGENALHGLDGDDLLDGGAGADRMEGGTGRDTYVVDHVGDVIVESGNDADTVRSSIDYVLAKKLENLELLGAGDLSGTGNAAANNITGNAGNNVLDGKAGADRMAGGLGDDSYVVDNQSDSVVEAANAGTDLVRASATFRLSSHVEDLTLTGTADIAGYGNDLANRLIGNAGANLLDGGLGADEMTGGLGHDTYVVDHVDDRVTERANGGIDSVQTSLASYKLGSELENLSLRIGTSDNGSDRSGTGNALGNTIAGSRGINTLRGLAGDDLLYGYEGNDTLIGDEGADLLNGGTGADRMTGGLGDDSYVVDDAADVVVEAADEGNDTIQTSITLALRNNVENLTLIGSSAIDGTGNAAANRLTGNAYANRLDGAGGDDVMMGGGGEDTYFVDSIGDVVIENASEGSNDIVHASVDFTLAANVENLLLLGRAGLSGIGNASANTITGNTGANLLRGLDGNDELNGGIGADRMEGGLGRDYYWVDNINDVIVEEGVDYDIVYSTVSYTLAALVDELVLQGTANLSGIGNELSNRLVGNAGRNTLDGRAGSDRMEGGLGDDNYVVDSQNDEVVELVDGGNDIVRASVGYQLRANVERLVLTGSDDIWGTGNDLANIITGNNGDNEINGGAGADRMAGGRGDDSYIVDNAGDTVVERRNGGVDTVRTALASYTLTAEVENLTLQNGSDNGAARAGTGNAIDNVITGSNGVNTLQGLAGNDVLYGLTGDDVLEGGDGDDLLDGGAGADRMVGGAGDDRYVVDNAADAIEESGGGGTDTIVASVSTILRAHIENLELTGSAALDGQGNGLANRITGNTGSNNLDGGGGDDVLSGGMGDDIYTVDTLGDVVIETPGAGTDTVRASVSYTLPWSVENLVLLGSAALTATGNAANNVIEGNAGNNLILGRGGQDRMTGGAGADTFGFLALSDSSNSTSSPDLIVDFDATAGDRIDISAIDAIAGTAANDAFTFIDGAAFTAAGQIRTAVSGTVRYLYLNTDSNLSTTEMVIAVQGATPALTADMLVL